MFVDRQQLLRHYATVSWCETADKKPPLVEMCCSVCISEREGLGKSVL